MSLVTLVALRFVVFNVPVVATPDTFNVAVLTLPEFTMLDEFNGPVKFSIAAKNIRNENGPILIILFLFYNTIKL
jgi:hypothetical protein